MSTTMRPEEALDHSSVGSSGKNASQSRSGFRIRFSHFVWLVVIVGVVLGARSFIMPMITGSTGPATSSTYTVVRKSFPVIEEAKGELKAAKTTEIRSKVEGRTTIIWLIEEGTTVKEGDLLVRLASDQIEETVRQQEAQEASAVAALQAAEKDLEILLDENSSNIRKGELAVELAEIELEKYREGDAKKKLEDLDLELARTIQMYERADDDFKSAKDLYALKFITKSEYLQDEFELDEANRSKKKAVLAKEIFEKYEYPKEIRRLTSDVEEAKKELERTRKSALAKEAQKRADVEAKKANLINTQTKLTKAREQLKECEIRAPGPGLVVYYTGGRRWNNQQIIEGAEVFERQVIVTLPDPAVMLVSVRIHEAKTHRIELGQRVTVEVDAIPGEMFTGEITKIAPLADSRNSWLNPDLKEYETEITLEESHPELKPGVTARAEIFVSNLDDVLCVPLQSVYTKAGHHYVFRDERGSETPVEVQIGESNAEFVEIVDGINADDKVFLAASDFAKSLLPNDLEINDTAAKQASAKPKGRARRGGRGGGKRERGPA